MARYALLKLFIILDFYTNPFFFFSRSILVQFKYRSTTSRLSGKQTLRNPFKPFWVSGIVSVMHLFHEVVEDITRHQGHCTTAPSCSCEPGANGSSFSKKNTNKSNTNLSKYDKFVDEKFQRNRVNTCTVVPTGQVLHSCIHTSYCNFHGSHS